MIAPIETIYKGYRFRSRLEARWAVFFDALGVKYEYEKEGFDIDGTWYLPDFYLPEMDIFVEIKPDLQSYSSLLQSLADQTNKTVLNVCGVPYYGEYEIISYSPGDDEIFSCVFAEDRRNEGFYWIINSDYTTGRMISKIKEQYQDHERYPMKDTDNLKQAYLKARQARFEYGEKG